MDSSEIRFLTSVYFFIPLKKIKRHYKRQLRRLPNEYKVEIPSFVHNFDDEVYYFPFPSLEHNKRIDVIERNYLFIFNGQIHEICMNIYLLKYVSKDKSLPTQYFIAVGTDVNHHSLLNEVDIVNLKKAFVEEKVHDGVKLTSNEDKGIHVNEMILKVLNILDSGKWENIVLKYSLVDVRLQKIENDETFEDKFYLRERKTVESIMNSCTNFAFGLLTTNDNYKHYDSIELSQIYPKLIGTPFFEQFYAKKGNFVFIRTHYPFNDSPKAYNRFLNCPFSFRSLPNVVEMCIAIMTDMKLTKYDADIDKNYPRRSFRKTISDIISDMNRSFFHVGALDNKICYILDRWGSNEWEKNIEKRGNQKIMAVEEKRSRTFNTWGIVIAVLSLIVACCSLYFACHSNLPGLYTNSIGSNQYGKIGEGSIRLILNVGEVVYLILLMFIFSLCLLAISGITAYRISRYCRYINQKR